MARRSTHTREELAELILATAQRVLDQEGRDALTARRLAGEIGYAPGTIYNHFAGLEAVVTAVNGLTLEQLGERLAAARTGQSAGLETLVAFAGAYMAFADEHPHRWALLFERRAPDNLPAEDDRLMAARIARLLSLVGEQLKAAVPATPEDRLPDEAALLFSALHGIMSLRLAGKLSQVIDADPAQMARRLVDRFVAGLSAST